MTNKKIKTKVFLIIILLEIIALIGAIFWLVRFDNKEYKKICSTPPHSFWLEEDLEIIFLTTQVNVLDIDNHGDGNMILKISVYHEGGYRIYHCLYVVERIWIATFKWKFERYV